MKNKRKMLTIVSTLLIIILVTISLMYFNTQENNTEIKSSLKEYNAKLEENENMHLEEDSSGDKIPVPNGYVGSKADGENEIDTGYVIYEGTEEVNNENVEEAQKARNQYVWIPVPDASKMYGTDEKGKKWGKLYDFTTDTGDNIDPITGTKPLNWSISDGIMKIISKVNQKSNREPDIVTNIDNTVYDMNSRLKNYGLGIKSTHEFLMQLEKEFDDMIESIKKYGGFYIGRYETGNLSQEVAVVKKGNTDISNQTWYSMYEKCKKLKGNISTIETSMIWGSQFDRTLMWLIESENKSKEEICEDSTSWGNYSNAEFTYINVNGNITTKHGATKIPTGSTEYTKANNIYDLAGNVWDWTIEGVDTFNRVVRGGYNYDKGTLYTANARHDYGYPANRSINNGCRAMLYIK